jgi:murein DD-endopeptidase MepM/ murein hydrolase activator NlpD
MSKNFYTLLIIPKHKSSVKKIDVPLSLIQGILISLLVITPVVFYVLFDYLSIKSDKAELAHLRKETKEQYAQMDKIASVVEGFAVKIEYLKQFDKKIRIMANLEGNRYKQQVLGIGGPESREDRLKSQMTKDRGELLAGIREDLEHLNREADEQEKSLSGLLAFLKEQKSIQDARPSIWPVRGWVTSEFGYRVSPFSGDRELHQGVDLACRYGSKVFSPADGIVTNTSYRSDLGNTITINNSYGISTDFGHLSRIAVRVGARVKRGDVIGYVGSTGRSTGPHLHYAVNLMGVPINPRKYLH